MEAFLVAFSVKDWQVKFQQPTAEGLFDWNFERYSYEIATMYMYIWAVLSDEQLSNGWPFSLLNDEQMSNKVVVEHQPDILKWCIRI